MALLAISQAIRPARTNPPTDDTKTLNAVAHPPSQVSAALDRACRDCHSNQTVWPWYTNVAPISWWIIDHVNEGRRHTSFSDFGDYDDTRRTKVLKESCEQVESGDMPLTSYLLVHRDARLTEHERQAICDWVRGQK